MKIYTKKGDRGQTSLISERVSKTDLRIEINGQIDELLVELAMFIENIKDKGEEGFYLQLKDIYRDLFKLMSIIADKQKVLNLSFGDYDITKLEQTIDVLSEHLSPLKNFIYYTGTKEAMLSQHLRAKVRSVERLVVHLFETEEIDEHLLMYLNRLSDYFYTLGRYLNKTSSFEEEILSL
ncbi:MAG: cob(I)yrinic acid a,c-diamide adenosyltransferase [Bacilli bacterium]|nr:cob(I)yrinic acid a,c-diamide adenosyltransferase [Bacilli bacterium]